MSKFKVEQINPGFGFKNYRIGNITVYTVKLRFKYPTSMNSIVIKFTKTNKKVFFYTYEDTFVITYETTNWQEMEILRKELWDLCREHAQRKLDEKYGQTEINFK